MTGAIGHLLSQAHETLGALDLRYAFVALLLQVTNMVCHAVAYRNVVSSAYPHANITVARAGAAYVSGSAFNTFLPARGGEAVKVGLLRMQVPHASVLTLAGAGSVVLLFDMLIGVTLFASVWALGGVPSPPNVGAVGLAVSHPWLAGAGVLAVAALARRVARPLARLCGKLGKGLAVLRSPGFYLRGVAAFQLAGWASRVGVTLAMLAAFGLPASLHGAVLIVVLSGVSTIATPGGAGAQQVLVVYALQGAVTAGTALAFSIGMQILVSLFNCMVGMVALMWLCGKAHPVHALRATLHHARDRAHEIGVHGTGGGHMPITRAAVIKTVAQSAAPLPARPHAVELGPLPAAA